MSNTPVETDPDITPMTMVSTMIRPTGKYSLNEGDTLGSYRIRKPLGRGGMGEVYLALHTKLNVLRAIKVLPARFIAANRNYGERFLQEARMAIQLEHPNVIAVYDADYDGKRDLYYIVMEYVDGGTVRSALRAIGAYNEKAALMIILKVSEALMAAEKTGLVHRDIKPDNIMLTRNGVVKLADMGIAKTNLAPLPGELVKDKDSITGTPAYMSPEQANNPNNVDGRADIYSLGVTLYEMLTATKPYTGEKNVDILKQVFTAPVPDPRKKNPQISKTCAKLIQTMMAKSADDRPASAEILTRTIKGILSGNTILTAAENKLRAEMENDSSKSYFNFAAVGRFFKSHWFLGGITAGITFFLLALGAFAIYVKCERPGLMSKITDIAEQKISKFYNQIKE